MSVKESLEELKRRVYLARGIYTVQEVAREMGIAPQTLRNWLRGDSAIALSTLATIEAWCDQKEGRHA